MHGPYKHQLRESGRSGIVAFEVDPDGVALAQRYKVGHGCYSPTMRESHVAAVFTAALLVEAGESVEVETVGLVGSGSKAVETVALRSTVRRDTFGRMFSTVGSKWNERQFVGA